MLILGDEKRHASSAETGKAICAAVPAIFIRDLRNVACQAALPRRAMSGDWKPVYGPASEAFPEEAGSEQTI